MKKVIAMLLLIAVALLFMNTAFAKSDPPLTFHNGATFGMTMDEVKALETEAPDVEEENVLVYRFKFAGLMDTDAIYYFSEETNTLDTTVLSFTNPITDPSDIVEQFEIMDQLLIAQFGEEQYTQSYIFSDDTYSKNPEDYPLALDMGQLKYQSQWLFNGFKVVHELYRENVSTLYHVIFYYLLSDQETEEVYGI